MTETPLAPPAPPARDAEAATANAPAPATGTSATFRRGLRRAVRRTLILTGTAVFAVVAVGIVSAGNRMIAANAVNVDVADAAPPLPVAATRLMHQSGYGVPVRFIGVVEPQFTVDLAFEAGGTVAQVLVEEGDTLARGAVIARLDTRALDAQRAAQMAAIDALTAQRDLAVVTEERQRRLAERQFSSQQRADDARFRVAELNARIAQAQAGVTGIDVALDKAVIRAPFAGRVGARLVDAGARVGGGQPVMRLLEDTAPRLRVGLPPQVAEAIAPGQTVRVTIGDVAYPARLDRARSDLDPVTRTLSALFVLDAPATDAAATPRPPFGEVGTLTLTRRIADAGAWLPISALTDGPRGLWTVFTVAKRDTGPIAAREAVEVLYADQTRAFVRGAIDNGALVVARGAHRLTSGQKIAPSVE